MEEQTTSIWTDLSPVCVLRRILREIPMILAMGLIAAMLTLTAAQCLYQPEYTASATVAVNAKNASYASVFSNLTTTSEIANTFTTLFGSDVFKTLSAEEQSEQQMSGRLTASVVPETNLLQLKVTAPEPVAAFRTLRFVLDHYDVISQHIFQNIVLRELDPPAVPAEPSNPLQLAALAKRAFLLGMLGMVVVLLAIIALSDTVQTADAVSRKLDAKLFGTIHHEEKNKTLHAKLKHANKGLLITMPAAGFYFTEEIQKLATRTVQAAERHHARVLLITSVAENEGKSTVAANLALALAQQDRKVLLIDADLHKASQYKLFRRRVRKSDELAEYLSGRAELQVEYLARKNLYTLFSVEPQPDASELLASERMRTMLTQLREEMDLIILDTPPMALFSDAEALAELADLSLLVVRQDCVAAKRLNDAADTLKQCRAHFLGCVFNDVRRMPSSGGGYGYQYGYGYRYGHSRGYGYGYGYAGSRKKQGGQWESEGTDEREKS